MSMWESFVGCDFVWMGKFDGIVGDILTILNHLLLENC